MNGGRHTIYDIAHEAGVSIATVSRVLRGEASVSEKTKTRVEDVILRLNYQPSAIARGLTLRHSRTLGIVLPKVDNPNYTLFFKGAYDEALKSGYAMSLFPWEGLRNASQSPSDTLAERRLDGVIICMEYVGESDLNEQLGMLESLRQYMPVVLIGCYAPSRDYPSVTIDLSECVRMVVGYLCELGHERIALVGGFQEHEVEGTRDAGYRDALREMHLPYISDYRAFGRCTAEDGERQMDEMLNRLIPTQWPTAVIAANDMVALGVVRAIKSHGKRVPEDISVVGCDDLFFAPYAYPPLTSIRTYQDKIGRYAVKMLLDEQARGIERVPCDLVKRESCAPPPHK